MNWLKGEHLWIGNGRQQTGVLFVIRRKVGNAVKRNRLKRRLRHICRQLPQPEKNIVVLALQNATGAKYAILQAEFVDLLSRL